MTGDGRPRLTPTSARSRRLPVWPRTPPRQAGIVHLGMSNFHRAHQAVYTARALDVDDGPWGVVGVARRSRNVLDAMRSSWRRTSTADRR